jgi:hypothetical protein
MRFIKDKEVLLSIWNAYLYSDELKIQLEKYHNTEKYEEIEIDIQLAKERKPIAVPLYDFYAPRTQYTFSLLENCKKTASAMEEAIAKIETMMYKEKK